MIHSYKLGGYNIVLDVGSGAVHAVDDLAYDVINLYETKSADEIVSVCLEKFASEGITEEDIRDTISDVEELKQSGKLYAEDIYAPLVGKLKSMGKIAHDLA